MARKKWVIDKRIPRTPEEIKWVESELNKTRTPEEIKKAILGLDSNSIVGWKVCFDKRVGAKISTCPSEPEIYWKEIEEEEEYANSHFSEIKKAFIDQIKQNPQNYELKEDCVPSYILERMPEDEWKLKDMTVKEKEIGGKCHYKNGFTDEEWAEIESALNNCSNPENLSFPSQEQQNNYDNWTREQLIAEINRLKMENERLKDNKILTTSERQARLQENQQKIEKINAFIQNPKDNETKNNNFPTGWVISGAVLLVMGGAVIFLVIRSRKRFFRF